MVQTLHCCFLHRNVFVCMCLYPHLFIPKHGPNRHCFLMSITPLFLPFTFQLEQWLSISTCTIHSTYGLTSWFVRRVTYSIGFRSQLIWNYSFQVKVNGSLYKIGQMIPKPYVCIRIHKKSPYVFSFIRSVSIFFYYYICTNTQSAFCCSLWTALIAWLKSLIVWESSHF